LADDSWTQIQGFKHDREISARHALNQNIGVLDSYCHAAPVIDTDCYMNWLRRVVGEKRCRFVTARITGDLLDQEDKLLARFRADAIVNATGLGSYDLARDATVSPLRGALIRVLNDGSKFPKIEEALAVSHDERNGAGAEDMIFIVPRNDKTLILGGNFVFVFALYSRTHDVCEGLVQPDIYSLDLTLQSPEIVRMRERCNKFVPGLENAEYDPVPLVQGLRPFRGANVRVEREMRLKRDGSLSRIIHSYGQGGSGFTLSFGCASDVLNFVLEMEAEMPQPRSEAIPMVRASM
jgi:glycine/D-amino acid oxidase-like deaminating enzyme